VWNVYPKRRTVDVVTLVGGKLNTLTHRPADTLSGAPVLPAFELTVSSIFD
jgi:hypothetical protein